MIEKLFIHPLTGEKLKELKQEDIPSLCFLTAFYKDPERPYAGIEVINDQEVYSVVFNLIFENKFASLEELRKVRDASLVCMNLILKGKTQVTVEELPKYEAVSVILPDYSSCILLDIDTISGKLLEAVLKEVSPCKKCKSLFQTQVKKCPKCRMNR